MNQRGGLATTVALLVAAILGISYLPRKSVEVGSPQQTSGKTAAKASALTSTAVAHPSKPDEISSCQQIERRLSRFYPDGVPVPSQGDCYAKGAEGPVLASPEVSPVTFAIAIAPNPVQTHLPLAFDRQIDAIQQAVQDTGFTYDSSWFPWNQSDKSYDSLSDDQQSAKLEAELQDQPGIIVFRRGASSSDGGDPYAYGMVVFVVAEQPTGGISDIQFGHALQWITSLQKRPSELRIIGPTFSGSLATLARELKATDAFSKFPGGIQIYSGATNADENVRWFQNFLAEHEPRQAPGEPAPQQQKLKFRTFFESDSLMTDRFLCFMQYEGYELNHFAILSEDETAFGKAASEKKVQQPRCRDHVRTIGGEGVLINEGFPVYLYYPRDIATLRSAYEEQGVFSAGKPQANGPSSTLKQNLSEPASAEHDTVRTYAGQLTPQAQEAILFGISNVLNQKHIEFIIVRSSNTLDQLFLSEFLRRSYPNGRVVIDGADLMFRRGMEGASLRGVMLLSPYPLLSWTHDSISTIEGAHSDSYRVFPQDVAEGTYIAAQPAVSIADYAPPAFGLEQNTHWQTPATWLTVVGHRQFWPVAVLNGPTEVSIYGKKPYGPYGSSLLEAEPVSEPPARTGVGLPGEMWAFVLTCLALAGWHCYCCARGSLYRPPRLRAYFAPLPRLQHTFLVFLGSFFVAMFAVIIAFGLFFGFRRLNDLARTGVAVANLGILLLAYLGCIRNYSLPVVTGESSLDNDNKEKRAKVTKDIAKWRPRLLWSFLPLVALAVAARYFILTYHLSVANRFPTFWRSVYLRSGVSPILPQAMVLLGFYAWYWFALRGLALFGDDRPVLPSVGDLPQLAMPDDKRQKDPVKLFLTYSREGAGNNIESDAMPLGRRYLRSLLLFLPIAYGVLWIALGDTALRTLGDIKFGAAIFLFVAVCIGLILADTMQLLNTWSQLRQLLIYLDRLRLRRTLATMRGLYGGSIWKLSGNVLEERYRLIARQSESLGNLANALQAWNASDRDEEHRKEIVLRQLLQCEEVGRDFTAWYANLLNDDVKALDKEYNIAPLTEFQGMLAATAGCVMKYVIIPEWRSDPNTMIRVSSSKDLETDFDKQVADLLPHVSAAEEFFLLPYVGFIQNIMGRVRTIGLSVVSLFIAATIGVSCYPFDPLPAIGAVFLIVFALAGAAIFFTYAEMCRDPTLSRIANTTPGELGWGFWVKAVAVATGPVLSLLTTLFPSMTDFIVSFLQPGAQAIK